MANSPRSHGAKLSSETSSGLNQRNSFQWISFCCLLRLKEVLPSLKLPVLTDKRTSNLEAPSAKRRNSRTSSLSGSSKEPGKASLLTNSFTTSLPTCVFKTRTLVFTKINNYFIVVLALKTLNGSTDSPFTLVVTQRSWWTQILPQRRCRR